MLGLRANADSRAGRARIRELCANSRSRVDSRFPDRSRHWSSISLVWQELRTAMRRKVKMVSSSSPIKYSVIVCLTAAITWSLSLVAHDCHSSSGSFSLSTSADNLMGAFTVGRKDDLATDHEHPSRHHHYKSKETKEEKKMELLHDYNGPSRVWTKFDGEWCVKGEKKLMTMNPAHEGLLFQRPMKVGSTTMVGVVLRLAHTYSPWMMPDKRLWKSHKCKHRSMHGSGLSMEYDKRDKSKSFLFSLIREPTKRAISEFFHFSYSAGASVFFPSDIGNFHSVRQPPLQCFAHDFLLLAFQLKLNRQTGISRRNYAGQGSSTNI